MGCRVKPVQEMIDAMGEGTEVPKELIPRCPHCGAEAFPWVRGYGNFLTGKKYEEEYQKISDYILAHAPFRFSFSVFKKSTSSFAVALVKPVLMR